MIPKKYMGSISLLLIVPVSLFVFPNISVSEENLNLHLMDGNSSILKLVVLQDDFYPVPISKQLRLNPQMSLLISEKGKKSPQFHLKFAKDIRQEVPTPNKNSKLLPEASSLKKLELRKDGFFGAGKYYFDDKPVNDSKSFQDIMKRQPAAYRVYRKARPWTALGTITLIGIAALTFIEASQTADKANKVQNGQMVDNKFESSTVVSLGGLAITSIFSFYQARKYQKKGVEKFNTLEMRGR